MISIELRLLFIGICTSSVGCQDDSPRVAPGPGDDAAGLLGSQTPQTLLATSASHSCALRETGLFCWGTNFSGQLGTGDLVDSEAAVAAKLAGADIVQVALSSGRTCIRRSTGAVACWGTNELGQRGDGTRDESLTATQVVGVHDAVDLALDDQTTCVVRGAARSVACWGGVPAEVGMQESLVPVPITILSGVIELRAGSNGEYCGRLQDESVRCWSLAEGAWTAPVEVPALAGARSIALAAFGEVCAILGPGPIQCHNLENGKTVPLDDSAGYTRVIGAGSLAACAVNGEGTWHCWNVLPPMLESVGSPRLDASSSTPIIDLVFSGFRFCALLPDHAVACGDVGDSELPEMIRVQGLPD